MTDPVPACRSSPVQPGVPSPKDLRKVIRCAIMKANSLSLRKVGQSHFSYSWELVKSILPLTSVNMGCSVTRKLGGKGLI
jgi:hypothetical protein